MFDTLRTRWRQVRSARPGERFREQYERSHDGDGNTLRKVLFLGGGAVVIAAGLFFLPAPGPGFLILFLGAGLMAQESLAAARALDWTEVRLRALAAGGRRRWQRASVPTRALLVVTALLLASAAAFGAYRLLFGRDGHGPA